MPSGAQTPTPSDQMAPQVEPLAVIDLDTDFADGDEGQHNRSNPDRHLDDECEQKRKEGEEIGTAAVKSQENGTIHELNDGGGEPSRMEACKTPTLCLGPSQV